MKVGVGERNDSLRRYLKCTQSASWTKNILIIPIFGISYVIIFNGWHGVEFHLIDKFFGGSH